LEEFLKTAVGELGVHRVLLIGGDAREPCGPYADGAAILRDGILSDLGINEVGLAGYPEGHPNISQDTLLADLDDKLELIDRQGMCGEIVTQFCFAPSRIIEYCAYLAQKTPETPVYVGMAGPTSAARLIRYANYCGVSASLRALGSMGVKVVNLLTHTDPSEQLDALAHYCATRDACNVIGAHLFSFGGFVESARWMRQKCRQN
jgi:methylenetetrahydrofolate reductase (NADPH)